MNLIVEAHVELAHFSWLVASCRCTLCAKHRLTELRSLPLALPLCFLEIAQVNISTRLFDFNFERSLNFQIWDTIFL